MIILLGGAELQGGIPFLPEVVNRGMGRTLLIGGILLTGLLGCYAAWEAWCLQREKRQT